MGADDRRLGSSPATQSTATAGTPPAPKIYPAPNTPNNAKNPLTSQTGDEGVPLL